MPISTQTGMGARIYDGGVGFRVWAPFAQCVAVAGEFNNWSTNANALSSEGNGYWSGDVPGAHAGQQYKYVITNGGASCWRNDPYAREVTRSENNSVIHDPNFDWQENYGTPGWDELVIYEMHIGTFNPSSSAEPGTFEGVIGKLDYLRDLGVNAIEVMASGEFNADMSWGYNPAYMFAIEIAYGGIQAFKDFVQAAHNHGIAVIFDVVYNHLGDPALDMWRFDGWSQGPYGGIYFYNDWRAHTSWGETRLDYGRGEVRQYIHDNALAWLESRRVDGLRWDATGWIRNIYGNNNDPANDLPDGWSLMQWINDEINTRQPWKISIAEDMQNNLWLTKTTAVGGAGFDSQWDAHFVHTIRDTIIPPNDGDRDMYYVADAIQAQYNQSVLERVVYTESHDEDANGHSRVPEEICLGNAGSYFSKKRSTLGAALVFTVPGIPMIFQGQEFLEDGWFSDSRALDWAKLQTYAGITNLYRDLIRLRRNWYNHTRGLRGENVNVFHINNADKVIAFHRWSQGGSGDDVVVVANMANRSYGSYTIGFPRSGRWKVRFNSDWSGYSGDFTNQLSYDTMADPFAKDGMPYQGNVGVGPYSVIVLSQDD
jgi:1,4-alpha-glucan branching enzyme